MSGRETDRFGAKRQRLAALASGCAVLALSGCGWAVSFETSASALADRIGFDPFGNVRLTGVVSETIDADPGEGQVILTGPSAGSAPANFDIVINGDGDYAASALTAAPPADEVASTIDDSSYRSGIINGTVDIDPGPGVTELTAGGGFGDLFFAKFDAFGRLLWANLLETDGVNVAWGELTVDANGDLLVVGDLNGSVDVDPGPGEQLLTSAGRSDAWVAKYNADGELLWATSLGGADLDRARSAALTPEGDLVLVGEFFGTAAFGPGPGAASFSSAGFADGFVVTLSGSNGEVLRAGALSSSGSLSISGDGVSVGADGVVTVAGSLVGFGADVPVDLDPGPDVANRVGGLFALRLAADGSLEWASAMANADQRTEVTSHAVGTDGSVLLGGSFTGDADFDPGPDERIVTADGDDDLFLMKMTADGALDWVNAFGSPAGTTPRDRIADVSIDGGGLVYAAGEFVGPIDFDPGPDELILTASSGADLFLMKLGSDGNLKTPSPPEPTPAPETSETPSADAS